MEGEFYAEQTERATIESLKMGKMGVGKSGIIKFKCKPKTMGEGEELSLDESSRDSIPDVFFFNGTD